MKSSNPEEIINILNSRYFDMTGDTDIVPFGFSTNGYSEVITFLEWPLWSSECDGYEDADQTSLADKVFDLFVEHMNKLNKIVPAELFYGTQWD